MMQKADHRVNTALPTAAYQRLTAIEDYLFERDGVKRQEFRREAIMQAVRSAEYDRQHRQHKEE